MRNAVVVITDAKIFPAAMFLAGRLIAMNPRQDTDIVVYTNAAANRALAERLKWPIVFERMENPKGINLPVHYFRIFVPDLLRDRYRRILYIDVDTWIEDARPFALFDLDMRGKAIAAVRDLVVAFDLDTDGELAGTIGAGKTTYFNSGVLLIDIAAYLALQPIARMTALAGRHVGKRSFHDQAVLNAFFRDRWLELSPAFNFFAAALSGPLARAFPPSITHFAGRDKPWHGPRFTASHPARREMERWVVASPWPRFLSRFVSVGDAMSLAPRRPPDGLSRFLTPQSAALLHLHETAFADVDAGITHPNLDALPVPLPPRAGRTK